MCAVMKHYEDIARAEGEARGEARGIMKALVSLVEKGRLTVEEAAEQAGISTEEFTRNMQPAKA